MRSTPTLVLLTGLLVPAAVLAHAGHGAPGGHSHVLPLLVPVLLAGVAWIVRQRARSKGPRFTD